MPNTDEPFGMNIKFSAPPAAQLGDGFNEYGVRENEDGSVDVRFNAMEPGTRKGINITPNFLNRVVSKDYSRIPVQLDHSDSQRANVGYIDPSNVQFNDLLQIQAHVPNTGSSVRDDVIADFTHEPPLITDISVSFDKKTLEVEAPPTRDGNPTFVDGRFREFSLTPFPGGYDNGGLTPAFSDAVDGISERAFSYNEDEGDAESQLVQRPHYLIERR